MQPVFSLFARNLAANSSELAAVDATQSSEVIFALLGGIIFLKSEAPNIKSTIGLVLILVGLAFFVKYQKKRNDQKHIKSIHTDRLTHAIFGG